MSTVLVPLAEGFEEIEAISIIDILRRAGLDVTTASISNTLEVAGAHKVTAKADTRFSEVKDRTFDAVVLPGGPAYLLLMEHRGIIEILQRHAAAKKVTAAICAAPAVLAKAGLLNGKHAACYPSVEGDVAKVAKLSKDAVVVDGLVATSRGPATAVEFALGVVGMLLGEARRKAIASDILFAA